MRKILTAFALAGALVLSGCGYNDFQTKDEQVKAAWSEVINQYKRRADLIPNLVNVVQGFAQQEKDVLLGVTNARSKVGSIQMTPEALNDPNAMKNFQAAQGELSSALSRLMVVVENYPQLKSDANFRALQEELAVTEDRIAAARRFFNGNVREMNQLCQMLPTSIVASMFSFTPQSFFELSSEYLKACRNVRNRQHKPSPSDTSAIKHRVAEKDIMTTGWMDLSLSPAQQSQLFWLAFRFSVSIFSVLSGQHNHLPVLLSASGGTRIPGRRPRLFVPVLCIAKQRS